MFMMVSRPCAMLDAYANSALHMDRTGDYMVLAPPPRGPARLTPLSRADRASGREHVFVHVDDEQRTRERIGIVETR